MAQIMLIYNPFAGDRRFKDSLDDCAKVFSGVGCMTHLLRATDSKALDNAIAKMDTNYRYLVVAGGDGTVNLVINALKRHGKDVPIGIIPAGTANDFASCLDMPKNPREAAEAIVHGRIIAADLGRANERYYLNSCGGGLFINVSHDLTTDSKSILGKLAYYLKGVGQLPNIRPYTLRITTAEQAWEEEFVLFLALNSSSSGGFKHMAIGAAINDGVLEFVAFRNISMLDLLALFTKVLNGQHLDDRRVLHLRTADVRIENLGPHAIDTDVDGEPGSSMPLHITCHPGAIHLVVPPMYHSFPRKFKPPINDAW